MWSVSDTPRESRMARVFSAFSPLPVMVLSRRIMAPEAVSTSPPASFTVRENISASAVDIRSFSDRSFILSPAETALEIRAVRPKPPPASTAAVLNFVMRELTLDAVPVSASSNPDTGSLEKVRSISFFVVFSSLRRPELSAPIFTINAVNTDMSFSP